MTFCLAGLVWAAGAAAQERCAEPVAHVVSLQGAVEIQVEGETRWRPAALDAPLCVGDSVRVGPVSRAALAFANDSVLRLDELTTLRLHGMQEERRSVLELLFGAVQFFSHRPRTLEVDTPFVNAAAEGTEFLVQVAEDRARVVMYEGRVRLANPQGELLLAAGDAAVVPQGAAPQPVVVVRPRDAVAWTIYYPPILTALAERTPRAEELPAGLRRAVEQVADNDYPAALAALDAVPPDQRDAQYWTYRAGVLLNVGRVERAEDAIRRALRVAPEDAGALAQQAVILIARQEEDEALGVARRAVELAPDSAPARIARSYAHQARAELEPAREVLREAVARAPGDALAWARLAEIELSFGALDAALEAAQRATALAPDLARTQTVLGFAALVRIDTEDAKAAFQHAITLDSADPLPRLGLGLARIRESDLDEGRREIEIAAGLDPGDALVRSYLGKAYFEETREGQAGDQFAIAKQLDPNDPTPWFYNALRLQAENRPVEALHDLQTSIRLNDNRAVYRSRLLLDQDLAARGARLGRIYNDLGFEQLALVEGFASLNQDPANYSAHRLLADNYLVLPRHEIARDSELLQAQLLQPINLNPVQPLLAGNDLDLLLDPGPFSLGLNEFTHLFVRNDIQFLGEGIAGTNDTFGDNVIVSGLYDRYSLSVGQFHFETDGFRQDNELSQNIYDVFGQASVGPRSSVLAEFRYSDRERGDPRLLFDPLNFSPTFNEEFDFHVARVGGHHQFDERNDTIATYAYRKQDAVIFIDPDNSSDGTETGHIGELRHIYSSAPLNATGGLGVFEGQREIVFFSAPNPPFRQDGDLGHVSAYGYADWSVTEDAILTVGLSADSLETPIVSKDTVSPKFGATWRVTDTTTIRAAAFRTLKRAVISSQTIEPTQVAGFNQFFDDINGTEAWRYGAALDQALSDDLFVGVEYTERDLTVPRMFRFPATRTLDFESEERLARAYGYWTPTERLAISLEYEFQQIKSEPEVAIDAATRLNIHRVPLEARYFHPAGPFAGLRATYFKESGEFQSPTGVFAPGDEDFWVLDASVGFRFPNQRGSASVEVRNLLDEDFRFQGTDATDDRVSRERIVLGRLSVTF